MPDFDEAHVLALAALASSEGGQDPVDEAIRSAALGKNAADLPKLTTFTPFDPATKMSEANAVGFVWRDPTRGERRVCRRDRAGESFADRRSDAPRSSRGKAFACWRSRPERPRR